MRPTRSINNLASVAGVQIAIDYAWLRILRDRPGRDGALLPLGRDPRAGARDGGEPARADRVTIPVSAPVSDALRRMEEADTGRLLVTDGGRVVGLVTRTGITRFIRLRADLEGDQAA